MKIVTIKTHKITASDKSLFKILDQWLSKLQEKSILAITSKIISICEARIVKIGLVKKNKLIKQEADYYLSEKESKYGFVLTIKNSLLIPSAGIDESNGNGYYILWPKNPQKTANQIRNYLTKRFCLKKVGVIITDSKTNPLRWGTTGVSLAYSGFYGLNDYIGAPDLFGRKLKVTKVNVADALAAAATVVMGEGNEQTPLAIISKLPFVRFNPRAPSKGELAGFKIKIKDDLYAPLLIRARWRKNLGKSLYNDIKNK